MIFDALAVFLSSFLLFQIQPLIGKYILPWFGGTAGVWSASLLTFQTLLTCGYAYSHWLVNRQTPKRQGVWHLVLLGLSLLLLGGQASGWGSPLLPGPSWRPDGSGQPLAVVLTILLVAVGGPYLLLAANSTLIQAWFAREHPGRSPYGLYALSNAGSFLGLLAYPFLVEPVFSLKHQALIWTGIYLLFVLVIAARSWRVFRNARQEKVLAGGFIPGEQNPGINLKVFGSWLGLAALASILLVATSSRMTQEVAAVPFLWVLPLGVYLLSFLLTFSGEGWYPRVFFLILLFAATIVYLWIVVAAAAGFIFQIGVYLVLLFACSMICHG
ncbi:MAG: hypothetical protein MUO62_13795, partial [Anaerolineales bacterium]|nr:hypothetical protein [Anaerolineales bacterium]